LTALRRVAREERFQRVQELMTRTFGLEEDQITPEARLVEDLRLDSLDWAELVVVLERETGEGLPESDLEAVRTVDDILNLVERKQAASS
jgi:acyl carrier protein